MSALPLSRLEQRARIRRRLNAIAPVQQEGFRQSQEDAAAIAGWMFWGALWIGVGVLTGYSLTLFFWQAAQ